MLYIFGHVYVHSLREDEEKLLLDKAEIFIIHLHL